MSRAFVVVVSVLRLGYRRRVARVPLARDPRRAAFVVVMRWVAARGAHGDEPPSPRFGHVAVAVKRGRYVVVFGGLSRASASSAGGALDDVVVLDVAHDAWFRPVARDAMRPRARAFHCACAIGSHTIVIACGRDGREQFGDAWALDAETWTWRELRGARTTPRDFASCASVGGESMVMFGGFDGRGWLGDVETLELRADGGARWRREDVRPAKLEAIDAVMPTTSGRTAPEARSGSAMVKFGPNVLVYGGSGANGSAFSDTWCLKRERGDDGSEDGWRWVKLVLRGHPPSARAGHAMAVMSTTSMSGGAPNIVVAGGVGDDGWLVKERCYFDDAHYLDGDNARWQRLSFSGEGNGPSSRAYHTLTHVSQNKCLFFGGFNGANACNDSWWLTVDDMDYSDISLEARASPRVLVDALRDKLKSKDDANVFEGNDAAFRQHLSACDVEDVKIRDVPGLMREYAAATSALGLPGTAQDGQGRFRHRDPNTMTLRDVGAALTELQGAYVASA